MGYRMSRISSSGQPVGDIRRSQLPTMGPVQAFPDTNHTVHDLDTDFKVIYGAEIYLVDDTKVL